MAEMTRCAICENFDFKTRICSIYSKNIPINIFIEKEECEFFSMKETELNDLDDELPIAKGR